MNKFNGIIHRIRKQREKLGLSYQELADKTGLSKSTLQRYETGAIKNLPLDKLDDLAKALLVSPAYLMGWEEVSNKTVNIPILGSVPAGVPIEAVTDIIGEVDIDEKLTLSGEYFALKIKGDSMSPEIRSNDIVIVRKQSQVESGEIAIVYVNGYHATCKRVMATKTGIILQPINPSFETLSYDWIEVGGLPVVIVGKITEVRRSL